MGHMCNDRIPNYGLKQLGRNRVTCHRKNNVMERGNLVEGIIYLLVPEVNDSVNKVIFIFLVSGLSVVKNELEERPR